MMPIGIHAWYYTWYTVPGMIEGVVGHCTFGVDF